MKHILKAQQFDRTALERLFADTDILMRDWGGPKSRSSWLATALEGKRMFIIFDQESLRTRFCFNVAARNLGMNVIETNDARRYSSLIGTETVEDMIVTLCQYDPSVIVYRPREVGEVDRAAVAVDKFGLPVPIINAGDGTGQHPTQALVDLFTIHRELGRTDNLTVTVGGNLRDGRTCRSLVYLLSKFNGIKFAFVAPPGFGMAKDITDHLHEHRVPFFETDTIEYGLSKTDVVYWTSVPKNSSGENNGPDMTIKFHHLRLLNENSIILHPFPRYGEIERGVDCDPRAAYFRQVRYGMFVRMNLLLEVCGYSGR